MERTSTNIRSLASAPDVDFFHLYDSQQQSARANHDRTLPLRTAEMILLRPLGTMESGDWQAARDCLFQLTKKASDPITAMKLLDRLYDEQCIAPVSEPYFASHYAMILDALARSPLKDKGELADQLFDKAHARYELNPNHQPQPDTGVYNTLIFCHASSDDANATKRVEALVEKMQHLANNNHPTVCPQLWTYNAVCLAYANRKGEYGSAKSAEDWLLKMADMSVSNGQAIQPDSVTFNLILKAWKNSGEQRGPDRAMEILRLMVKLYADGSTAQPDEVSFNTVMHAYTEQGRGKDATEALEYIKSVVKEHQMWIDLTTAYNAAIHAWDRSLAKDAGDQAKKLLENMFEDSRDMELIVKPNELAMFNVLSAYGKARNPQAAEDLLHRIIETYQNREHTVVPTTNICNAVVRAWIKLDHFGSGADRAKQLLMYMMELAGDPAYKTWPNRATFNLVIDGYRSQPGSLESSYSIIDLIDKMTKCFDAGYSDCQPSSFTYSCLFDNILRSPPHLGLAKVAVETLHKLEQEYFQNVNNPKKGAVVKPDVVMYNTVLQTLSRLGDDYCKQTAMSICRSMESKYHDGHKDLEPGNITYTMVLKTFMANPSKADIVKMSKFYASVERLSAMENRSFKLDSITTQTMLVILKNARSARAAYEAEAILAKLNLNHVSPKLASEMISCVVLAFVQVSDEGSHDVYGANLLLKYVDRYDKGEIKTFPAPQAFTIVIRALAVPRSPRHKYSNVDIINLGRCIYGHATRLFKKDDIAICHFAMLHFLSANGLAKEAATLLLSLHESGVREVAMHTLVWRQVLHAYARHSSTVESAIDARAFFDEILTLPGVPKADVKIYNDMLNAALISGDASLENREVAWKIMERTFHELQASTSVKPDHVSYSTFAKAHRFLLPVGELQFTKLRDLFLKCRACGLVDHKVLREALLLPEEWKTDLFEGVDLSKYDVARHRQCVPEEWTAGIPRHTHTKTSDSAQ